MGAHLGRALTGLAPFENRLRERAFNDRVAAPRVMGVYRAHLARHPDERGDSAHRERKEDSREGAKEDRREPEKTEDCEDDDERRENGEGGRDRRRLALGELQGHGAVESIVDPPPPFKTRLRGRGVSPYAA